MCDCEAPSAFYQKARRARSEHRCCECGTAIPAGALYQYTSGVWDGQWQSYKTCLDCQSARDFLMRECVPKWDCGPCFTQLFDGIYEYREEVEFAIGRVLVASVALVARFN